VSDQPFPSASPAPPGAALPPRPAPPAGITEQLRDVRRDPRLAVAALVVIAVGAGVFWFRTGVAAPTTGATHAGSATPFVPRGASRTASAATTSTAPAGAAVVVDVAGAVVKPGVVTLPAGSRVIDAIAAAGGAKPNADLDRLNLAEHVADGVRVAVPMKGQPPPALDPTTSGESTDTTPSAANPLNLNSASEAQLEALPGIGPSLAAAILQEREQLGSFRSVDDLKRVRGIGDARFAQLQPLVTV
jgi:competence protein ComEA